MPFSAGSTDTLFKFIGKLFAKYIYKSVGKTMKSNGIWKPGCPVELILPLAWKRNTKGKEAERCLFGLEMSLLFNPRLVVEQALLSF